MHAKRTKFEHATPILSVADMKRSLRYYVQALGFRNAEWVAKETEMGRLLVERFRKRTQMLLQAAPPATP